MKDPNKELTENKDKQGNMALFTGESQKSMPEFYNSKYPVKEEKKVHVRYFDGRLHVNEKVTIEIQYRLQTGEIGWASMAEMEKNSNFYMKNKLQVLKCKERNSILSGQEANYKGLQRHRIEQYQKKWRIVAQTGHLQDGTWISLFNDELKISVKIQTIASELKCRKLKWLQSIGRHLKENLQQTCFLTGSDWSPPKLDQNFSAEHVNPYLIQTMQNLENFAEKEENFRTDFLQEKTQRCGPKMQCREGCEVSWKGICNHICRYSLGHTDQFHMCDPCYRWWQGD